MEGSTEIIFGLPFSVVPHQPISLNMSMYVSPTSSINRACRISSISRVSSRACSISRVSMISEVSRISRVDRVSGVSRFRRMKIVSRGSIIVESV